MTKAKGIANHATAQMKHVEYLNGLDGETITTATMQRITSDKQSVMPWKLLRSLTHRRTTTSCQKQTAELQTCSRVGHIIKTLA